MRRIVALLSIVLICGCQDSDKLQQLNDEVNRQRVEINNINTQLSDTKRESQLTNSRLMTRIGELETENRILIEKLSSTTNELAVITDKYSKLTAALEQRKQALLDARSAEQHRQETALNKIREANLPSDYPFRIFSAKFIGQWTQNGIKDNYAVFSVRNYTANQLEGTATSVGSRVYIQGYGWREDSVRIIIPPNSTKERYYIRANENGSLRIQSNLGVKEVKWEK